MIPHLKQRNKPSSQVKRVIFLDRIILETIRKLPISSERTMPPLFWEIRPPACRRGWSQNQSPKEQNPSSRTLKYTILHKSQSHTKTKPKYLKNIRKSEIQKQKQYNIKTIENPTYAGASSPSA